MDDRYLPIVVAALTVLILGCLNPVVLQSMQGGKSTGHPSYMWLSFAALVSGLLTCFLMHGSGKGGRKELALGDYL